MRILYSACLRAPRAQAVGLSPSADTHDHRALPRPAPCRAARGASPAETAPRNCAGHASAKQLRWARAHAASQPSGRTPAIDISRDSLRATRPPASLRRLRRLHPETSRHRTRELRDHAAPSARRIATRRRLAGVRQTGAKRPSVRGAISDSARGAISAQVPPYSPSRHARSTRQPRHTPLRPPARTPHPPSAHLTMDAPRHAKTRARRSTPRSTSSPTSSEPRDTNPSSAGVCPNPAGRHACGAASVGLTAARARPVRMLHAHEAACARFPLPRLPDSVDSAPAARRDATCAGHRHVRARAPPRLFC